MTRALRYWLPVVAWMLLIYLASTDFMSARHTSRFIEPFLRWIHPEISAEGIRAVQFAVRKMAHVTEYAILAALLVRALRKGEPRLGSSQAALAVSVAAVYAALDEYHQSFVASRTGSPGDVLIDTCGAFLGVGLSWWLISRRETEPADRPPEPATVRR